MLNNNLAKKIAQWANSESPSQEFYFASGSGTGIETTTDTEMDTEEYRDVVSSIESNNETIKFNKTVPGFVAGFTSADCSEIGLFDDAATGNMQSHTMNFSPITPEATKQYFFTEYAQVYSGGDSANVLTAVAINKLMDFLEGTSISVPTHVGFSTHLILDSCNVTTGWTQGGQGAAPTTSTNYVEGVASLSLAKSGTAGTQSTWTKAITSVNATPATNFQFYLRINSTTTLNKLAATNAVKVRIGSDSSNYYQVAFDRSDFLLGWQKWDTAISTMTVVGTPILLAMDYVYIEYNTVNNSDTIAADEILMDMWALRWNLDDSDTTLHNEIIRKIASTVARENTNVTFSGSLTTSEGNTYNYYYMGLFDAASSGNMYIECATFQMVKDINTQINFEFGFRVKLIG